MMMLACFDVGLFLLMRMNSLRLHSVHDEAEFVAQRLLSVGHADLGNVGPTDVVAFITFF